jgi:PTS system nitrogen regulatory IIA component
VPQPRLHEALEAGGVHYRVCGTDKASVLRDIVHIMRLPEEVDRSYLYEVLLAREALGSTGIGDGIAIPHVRNPIVLHISRPMIALCFLEQKVDFGALDGQPVGILFTLISPTVRAHLHLLSKLAFALRDPRFKDVVTHHGSRQEIYTEACRIEDSLPSSATNPGMIT